MKTTLTEKATMRDAFGNKLLELSLKDESVYVLDGDLANSTKVDKIANNNPRKFLQMGIAEQNMLSLASGLATTGIQPWVSTFAAFLSKRAIDQVQVQIAQPNLNVKMVGGYSGLLTGLTGKTHQSLEDIAIFRSLANMLVLAPADSTEVEKIIEFAHQYKGPVYMRIARDPYPIIFDDTYSFQLGKAVTLTEGKDVTIISTGTETSRALEASKQLLAEDISASVMHMPSIKPLDKEAIIQAAKSTHVIVTAEEHSIYGGLGSAVAEVLVEEYPVPMLRVGVKDRNAESGPNEEMLKKYEISANHIVKTVKEALTRK
ncbi:transketolase family protein [Virgibacillus pantothenticus]|uniref:transketolase family protein n=1 Tax=Virgibacillus pantothenticus TaxID=1473 RepID=UPI001C22A973|nr:transketolase C-terminal domain-containing protein [Virgibacillus pantothenticus]MBU8568542.1 transketolase family protein [Virgibacillus pantothenticus]MBU8602487.1 transketolase family protein [Virgibacillus pantothenticus]MBU8636670.1 transketolase family protein [Virgibacillus pantothenticus]MBU8644352.1 transketolase family protein [Virgibacillus pantothenticus]MBU8648488.1 transketolase family protein [Virgibacillus pantothenticus]